MLTAIKEAKERLIGLEKLVERRSAEADVAQGVLLEKNLLIAFENVQVRNHITLWQLRCGANHAPRVDRKGLWRQQSFIHIYMCC
jgi:hypothetical protein